MNNLVVDSQGQIIWGSVFILAFAVVFLIVGIMRVVEFRDVGLSSATQRVLTVIHIAGCLLFASALAMFAIDIRQQHKMVMYGVFMGGLLTLFPIHIYVALRRRRKLRELDPN